MQSEDVHDVCLSPQINFCHIFRSLNLVNFGSTSTKALDTAYIVNATPPTILDRSFWNFGGGVFVMV